MKYCPNCGNKIKETDKFCGKCGNNLMHQSVGESYVQENKIETNDYVKENVIEKQKQEYKDDKNANKNTNIYANIGLILSLMSILCCGMTAPIALITSIIGLLESKNNGKNGFEVSIAGIIISSILILITMIFSSIGKIIASNF